MAGDIGMERNQLAGLPSEILGEIIRFLLDDITINKRSGHPHSYYTPNYRKATAQSTKALLSLCLVSHRLRAAATIQLYRHVTLVPRGIPGSPTASHPEPHDSIVPLSLFLRTLIERPEMRQLVHSLDCRFFLRHVEFTQTNLEIPTTSPSYPEEFEFYKRIITDATRPPGLSNTDFVLDHIAATTYQQTSDLSERVMAAIICLIPELQSLALAPLPCPKWRPVDSGEQHSSQPEDDCHYRTLSSLLEGAYRKNVSPGMLQNLDAIRFTGVIGFKPIASNQEGVYHPEDDPTLRVWPEYTFPLSACLELLQGPNIAEFEADALDEFTPDAFHIRSLPMHSSIKRAHITISHPVLALENIGHIWNLTALSVRPAHVPGYGDEDDFDALAADLDLWDKSLLNMKGTLKELDLGYVEGYELPSQRLNSLPRLEALEHLSIGIPLLARMENFAEFSLDSLLPPNLKTLRIHDWVTGDYYDTYFPGLEHLQWTEDETEDGLRPLVTFQIALSTSLRSFAGLCGTTHPHLRSIMIFGFRPVDRAAFYSGMNNHDFYTAARELELSGPEPGQVVRGGDGIRKLFAASNIEFEEFFHAQEVHMSFRQSQVSLYQ